MELNGSRKISRNYYTDTDEAYETGDTRRGLASSSSSRLLNNHNKVIKVGSSKTNNNGTLAMNNDGRGGKIVLESINPIFHSLNNNYNDNQSLNNNLSNRIQSVNRDFNYGKNNYNMRNINNNFLNNKNYYSANESYGEEEIDAELEYYSRLLPNDKHNYANDNQTNRKQNLLTLASGSSVTSSIRKKSNGNESTDELLDNSLNLSNQRNTNNNINKRNVSYASITLRKPLKDLNYFSDSETLFKPSNINTSNSINKLKNISTYNNNNNNNKTNNLISKTYINSNNNYDANDESDDIIRETANRSSNNKNIYYNELNRCSNPQKNSLRNNSSNSTNPNNNNNNNLIYNPNSKFSYSNNLNNNNHRNDNKNSSYISSSFSNSNLNSKQQQQLQQQHENYLLLKQKRQQQDLDILQLERELERELEMLNNQTNNNIAAASATSSAFSNNFNARPHGFSKLNPFYQNKSNNYMNSSQGGGDLNANKTPIVSQSSFFNPVNLQNNLTANKWTPPSTHNSTSSPGLVMPFNTVNNNNNNNDSNSYSASYEQDSRLSNQYDASEDYIDPLIEKYEREMGSELAKPSNSKYSDSYFYNSSVFNYPTIEDQKKLAKSIANTLEGSNPETSKYHKKKQNLRSNSSRGDDYDSSRDTPLTPGYFTSQQENDDLFGTDQQPLAYNSFAYDDSLPDIIKRSIAKASMNDPVRMVQAPENFKQQHYTEHVTHTEMPPKAAMSLAAALETSINIGGLGGVNKKGGRGAEIFQKRKAKSEKWVIDESNVKRPLGYQSSATPTPNIVPSSPLPAVKLTNNQMPSPPAQQNIFQSENEIFLQDPYSLNHYNNNNMNTNKYADFNVRARGWGGEQQSHQQHYNPNKLDLSTWKHQQQQTQPQSQNLSISKEGIQNLKYKLNESAHQNQGHYQSYGQPLHINTEPSNRYVNNNNNSSNNREQQENSTLNVKPHVSKVKLNKLSSHENYLFNNRNALDALRNGNLSKPAQQQNHHQQYQTSYYEDSIAASDL